MYLSRRQREIGIPISQQMRPILVVVLLLIQGANCFAQQIKGHVLSLSTKQPIPFASIALLNLKDSTLIASSYTDSLGRYQLNGIHQEAIIVHAASLGSRDKFTIIKVAELLVTTQFIVPDIYLETTSHQLANVAITADKPLIIRKSDRFVIDTNTGAITGNNVWDILKNTPLVTADEQAGLNLMGRQSAIVYVNGRKNNLSGDGLINYLKSLPAAALDNIELITSPGSNYDASGNGGIINLVLKKKITDGFQGRATFSDVQATYNTQRLNGNLNYRKNRLGLNASIYGNRIRQKFSENSSIIYKDGFGAYNENNTSRVEPKNFHGFNLNAEYSISKKQILGILVDFGLNQQDLVFTTNSVYKNIFTGRVDSSLQSVSGRKQQGHSINVSTNYHIETNTPGESLDISVDFLDYLQKFNQVNITTLVDKPGVTRDNHVSSLPQKINNYTLALDYSRLIKKTTKVDLGVRVYNTATDNDLYFGLITKDNTEVKDLSRSNYFKYDELVNAGYVSISKTLSPKIETKVGVRVERSVIKGNQFTNTHIFNNIYTNIFPSLYLGYSINKTDQLAYSLTSRINRPSFGQVNPFRFYQTPLIFTEGNPLLRPSQVFKNEITYVLRSKYTFIANHSYSTSEFSQFLLSPRENPGQINYKYINYGSATQMALAANVNINLLRKLLAVSATGVIGRVSYNGSVANNTINNSSLFAQINLNNKVTLSSKKQLFGFVACSFNSRQNIPLGERKAYYNIDIGARKSVKSFAMSLYVTDVLRSNINNAILDYQFTQNKFDNYYDNRSIQASISYEFGNDKVQANKKRNGSNSEIRNRTGNN
ncbi:hypothetical protein CDA63_18675 [Hymenobacter amundsenii]|uniref:Outer membrane protein beta-barrel domain-containing protein n=1 Tax=Hymenobacter amundsenii TaxID=2006685 RepID=A0A246FGB4_9BACT|nr:outer membrane beta-barrel protein [Hymenobacter amundsenii]OWP61569.1 hypothetical protein CDA63_18675 [Hymenobacter amundsenii]